MGNPAVYVFSQAPPYPLLCRGESLYMSEHCQPSCRPWSATALPADTSLAMASLTSISVAFKYLCRIARLEPHAVPKLYPFGLHPHSNEVPMIAVGVHWDVYFVDVAHASWHPVTPAPHSCEIVRVCWVCVRQSSCQ